MATIPVELPDHLQSYVDESAEQAGFASASEYIVALVAAESKKQGEIEQALIAGRGANKIGKGLSESCRVRTQISKLHHRKALEQLQL